MEQATVGSREFREELASYVLDSETPVTLTRHGDTFGYFIPARRKRTGEQKAALDAAVARLQESLTMIGLTEDEIVEDFKQWRQRQHR